VLRNAAVPLVSLFFTETLTVLFVSVYVAEVAVGVPGPGRAAFEAIEARDIGLILATTLLPVFVGVFGNLLQDLVYGPLDSGSEPASERTEQSSPGAGSRLRRRGRHRITFVSSERG